MARHRFHGRGWIGVVALVVLIAVHIGLLALVLRTPLSLGLVSVVLIAAGALKYVKRTRRPARSGKFLRN